MIFSSPEREVLRQCAALKPDWSAMRAIARTALDYGKLRRLALLHQLDGVVAWRLRAPELDGTVPNIVRDDCQRYLDYLRGAQDPLWDSFDTYCGALKAEGIQFAVTSGPVQYAPLGPPVWPREWSNVRIDINARGEEDIVRVADVADAVECYEHFPAWHSVTLKSGLVVDITDERLPPHNLAFSYDWNALRSTEIVGREWPTLHPKDYVAYLAYDNWKAYSIQATRLSLWGLARLVAWASYPEWTEGFRDVLNAYDDTPAVAFADHPGQQTGRFLNAPRIAWALRLAARVYDFALPDYLPTVQPLVVSQGHQDRGRKEPEIVRWLYECSWPGDEAFLFDHALTEGAASREQAGIWSRTGQGREIGFDRDGTMTVKGVGNHA